MAKRTEDASNDNTPLRPRPRSRVRYALREFLLWPLLVSGVWLLLAVLATMVDRSTAVWVQPLKHAAAVLVPPEATTTLLSTITPGLLTVISIIFFVLLMAVQHQSATYSPVVLDQFLRRKFNQAFFGLFVGLTVYCLLALALVPSQALVSGAVALLLSVATFVALLVFVYNTIDQIRPSATVWMLQQLAVRARAYQQPLLTRCRASTQHPDAPATPVTAERGGYLVHINGELLAQALDPVRDTVEVELRIAFGEHIVAGAVLATVRGGDSAERDRLANTVLDALTVGRMRDIDRDAAHGVDHLASMAWSATAASGDPEGARIATEALHSLLMELEKQDKRHAAGSFGGPLPLIYRDPVTGKILDGLTSVIAASGQSGQHQTCSTVLTILSRALPQLDPDNQHIAFDRLQRVLPTVTSHVFTYEMEQAFHALRHAMHETDLTNGAQRIQEIQNELRQQQRLNDPTNE